MKEALLQFFAKFQLFDENEILAIIENSQVEHFKKGTIILKEGEISTKCYFVLAGCVRQYLLVDGEEKTTAFFSEEQVIVSYSSYMNSQPSEHFLSCVEDCILIAGKQEQEQQLHQSYPRLKFLIYTIMNQDYANTQKRLDTMIRCNPEERYLILLKTQPELINKVPLHQIASFIGVTPESLSRIRKRILKK